MTHPQTPDYLAELVTIDLSKRLRWATALKGAGEFDLAEIVFPDTPDLDDAFGRKCRAEYVDCLEIFGADKGVSLHDGATEYVAGQRITPDGFDDNWLTECGQGIHFYLSRIEAEAHT